MSLIIVGIDEVGRGCIAGPVIAAAVVLDRSNPINGLADSKKLSPYERNQLSIQIKDQALDWSIGHAEALEIDEINILQASLLAMKRSFNGLTLKADFVKVDGIFYPNLKVEGCCIKGGDVFVAEISAASIIAKVYRDEYMQTLDVMYPGYELSQHKGYPTSKHKEILAKNGVSSIYRQTFAPVKNLLA